MKKAFFLLLTAFTILTLTACTVAADETDRITQQIAQTDTLAAENTQTAAVQVQTLAPDSTPEPLPEAGDSVAFATPASVPAAQQDAQSGEITAEAARAIALAHAGLAADEVTYVRTEHDFDDGCAQYEIEFYHGDHEYDYDIDACTGSIRSFDTDIEHHSKGHHSSHHSGSSATPAPQSGKLLTESQVKAIALAHAGVAESDARFEKIELDKDKAVWEYEIEFRADRTEYEYEIDAYSGKVLDYDKDYED